MIAFKGTGMEEFRKAARWFGAETQEARERRERLARGQAGAHKNLNRSYSSFVRMMRLVLPLTALAIIAVLFTWSNMKEDLVIPPSDPSRTPSSIGKNELVNPRFESKDEKGQPYTITARLAVQSERNDELIILEKPVADMALNSGNWIAIEADQGAYRQDKNRLLLQGNVKMFHDGGYQLDTDKLHVDFKHELAWSEEPVYAQGPAGTLEARGMRVDSARDTLIFNGPAKLVMYRVAAEETKKKEE